MRSIGILAAAAVALGLAAPGAGAAPPRQDPDSFSPLAADVLAPPWAVKGSDGRTHVVYEVRLLNTTSMPWRVTRVSAR